MCPLFVGAEKTHWLPAALDRRMSEDRLHPRSHRNAAAGIVGLAVLNLDLPVADALWAKAEALFGAEPAIEENGRDIRKQGRVHVLIHGIGFRACEVEGFFVRTQDSFAMVLAGDHAHLRQGLLDLAPFLRQVKHPAERLELAIDAADLHASFFARRDERADGFRVDGIQPRAR